VQFWTFVDLAFWLVVLIEGGGEAAVQDHRGRNSLAVITVRSPPIFMQLGAAQMAYGFH
jgi:hypothetical protein